MKSNSEWSQEKDKLIDLIFNQHKSYENKNSDRYYYKYGNRSAQKETSDVENPLNGES